MKERIDWGDIVYIMDNYFKVGEHPHIRIYNTLNRILLGYVAEYIKDESMKTYWNDRLSLKSNISHMVHDTLRDRFYQISLYFIYYLYKGISYCDMMDSFVADILNQKISDVWYAEDMTYVDKPLEGKALWPSEQKYFDQPRDIIEYHIEIAKQFNEKLMGKAMTGGDYVSILPSTQQIDEDLVFPYTNMTVIISYGESKIQLTSKDGQMIIYNNIIYNTRKCIICSLIEWEGLDPPVYHSDTTHTRLDIIGTYIYKNMNNFNNIRAAIYGKYTSRKADISSAKVIITPFGPVSNFKYRYGIIVITDGTTYPTQDMHAIEPDIAYRSDITTNSEVFTHTIGCALEKENGDIMDLYGMLVRMETSYDVGWETIYFNDNRYSDLIIENDMLNDISIVQKLYKLKDDYTIMRNSFKTRRYFTGRDIVTLSKIYHGLIPFDLSYCERHSDGLDMFFDLVNH
jgi:hypothetical protein